MPAKRYWRVHSRKNAGDGSWHQFAEMEFRTAPGGADQCNGGVAACSSGLQSGSAAAVFANDGTTSWAQWSGSTDKWVSYDFGAGNERDIVEIAMWGAVGAASRTPGDFDVQWSDDNVNWTTEWSCSFTGYTTNVAKVFTKPAVAAHRRWRVRGLTLGTGLTMSCAELEFRETVGGADQANGGTATASTTFGGYPASNAFDNNTSTLWSGNNGAAASEWIAYDFGVERTIVEAVFTARNDSNFNQSPTSAVVESSPDGENWITRFSRSGMTWSAGASNTLTALSVTKAQVAQVAAEVLNNSSPNNKARFAVIGAETLGTSVPEMNPLKFALISGEVLRSTTDGPTKVRVALAGAEILMKVGGGLPPRRRLFVC